MRKRYLICSMLFIITNLLFISSMHVRAAEKSITGKPLFGPAVNTFTKSVRNAGGDEGKIKLFLKIDGIKGESQSRAHRDSIEILSYSFESNPVDGTKPYAIRLVKCMDSTSPIFLEKIIKGSKSPAAQISICDGEDENKEICQMLLKNMSIISYGQFVDRGNGAYEEICLYYDTIQFKYDLYDDSGRAYPVTTTNSLRTN